MSSTRSDSALDAARRRFQETLGKKSGELRASAMLVAGDPDSGRGRDELLRRLKALAASAVVFREDALVERVSGLVRALEASRAEARAVSEEDLTDVMRLARDLGAAAGVPADDPDPAAPSPAPPETPRVPNSAVVSVLLVGPLARKLAAALPSDRFEVVVATAAEAEVAARYAAPDVIVCGDDVSAAEREPMVDSLRRDPASDLAPILYVQSGMGADARTARQLGLDDAISARAKPEEIADKIIRLSGTHASTREAVIGTRSLRDVAKLLSEELERGLVDAVDRGADDPVPFGDGTELYAAVWSAIARIRGAVADRSADRVRFRDLGRRTGRSFLSVGESVGPSPASQAEIGLAGRRILVADDDPAVLWFFAGLLREAGAEPIEAPDGQVALDLARRNTPDLVLTDILMPRLDGMALARAMRRDPMLADVPVVFLSWKDDYLQRMRELRAGGAGYLRKEEASTVILDRVRDALRPRVRFEQRLSEAGEVRGRIEGLGVLALVRSVSRIRRDARLTLRDVRSQYELEVRRGQIVELSRTTAEGASTRGRAALLSMLGVVAGRFAVLEPSASARTGAEPIDPTTFENVARRVGALCDAVSGKNLALADHVELDDDALSGLLTLSPPGFVEVARRLHENPSPRRWLLSGEIEPEVLADAMLELARRGCIVTVRGENGEDLVQRALDARIGVEPEADFVTAEPEPEAVDDSQLEEIVALEESAQAVRPRVHVVMPDQPLVVPATNPGTVPVLQPTPPGGRTDDTLRVRKSQAAEPSAGSALRWVVFSLIALLLVALAALLYVHSKQQRSALTDLPATSVAAAQQPTESASAPAAGAAAEPPAVPPVEDTELYGEVVELGSLSLPAGTVSGLAVEVPEGAVVKVDGVLREQRPVVLALPPGHHGVDVQVGDDLVRRFIPLRSGEARRLRVQ